MEGENTGMEEQQQQQEQQKEMLTIKFGKGLVGTPFQSKKGDTLVSVSIPNQDPNEKKLWDTFVTSPDRIQENKFGNGNGCFIQVPAYGQTTICSTVELEPGEDGRRRVQRSYQKISNAELKARVEAYKTRDREAEKPSVREGLEKAEVTPRNEAAHSSPKKEMAR